jgi:hypothetical protein
MAIGREEEYLSGNSHERLVLMVDMMFRRNLQGFFDLEERYKKSVMFLDFEEFVTSPYVYLDRISKFIGDEFGNSKNRIMRNENVPRRIDPQKRNERINEITRNLSGHFVEILEKLIQDYDSRPWLGIGYPHEK